MQNPERPRQSAYRKSVAVTVLVLLLAVGGWQWHEAQQVTERAASAEAKTSSVDETVKAATARQRAAANSARIPAGDAVPADPAARRCTVERRQQLRSRLAEIGTPDSPYLAIQHALLAMMSSSTMSSLMGGDISGYMQSARGRWPNNLDVAWLDLMYCQASTACDQSTALGHVIRLDPDNAATWLYAMHFANMSQEDATYEQALSRAASAKFYDPRSGLIFLHLRPMLADLAPPESCLTAATAADLETSLGRPLETGDWADLEADMYEFAGALPVGALSPCRPGDTPLSPHRKRDCLALLGKIADGDMLLEQQLALAMLLRLVDDPAQSEVLRERYRRTLWLSSNFSRLTRPMPRDYGVRMWADGEVNLLIGIATKRGLWPPPQDWLPEDEERRALIIGQP